MANRMLGKVVAGAALGGASLLVFSPAVALADGPHHDAEGKVYAKPHAVKPGHEVKLIQVCEEAQEHAYVWSKVTGKVKLKPAHDQGGRGDDRGDRGDWRERDGKDRGGDEGGQPPAGGWGGGDVAPDGGEKDWKGYEHGQDAEAGRDGKAHEGADRGGESRDWKNHDEYDRGGESHDWKKHDEYDRGGESHDWKNHESDWAGESGDRAGESGGWTGESGDRAGESGDWAGESGERDWSGKSDEGDQAGKRGDKGWEHKKDFVYYGEARVSPDAKPGTYKLEGSCGEGELVVLPHGGVDGGDGGVGAGTDRELATAGASLVGAAALGGLVLMRRRRTDESVA